MAITKCNKFLKEDAPESLDYGVFNTIDVEIYLEEKKLQFPQIKSIFNERPVRNYHGSFLFMGLVSFLDARVYARI